ncbi:cell wall-associated NlpC family hydrolase [Pseudonocardia hierapolitana]|uniref:Cell wall-associated NlpC family hydrolase n=1 Tax=Pseudonocardia hierapolitana TaxID=1128676 RepID=A0A561SRR1_9PSEU|nr:cell wall-associated NlpC family hydrolase [Pseudonocardia hierapolitana]
MPKHLPALAVRAAVVTTAAAAASVFAVLPGAAEAAPAAPVAVTVTPVVQSAPVLAEPAVAGAAAAATRAAAVDHAMSKVGSPYRYGASGPNAFDCSGLVSWAFKKAGKSLPRTSRAQSKVGTPVSRGELQPGDLVFFYKPVSHVGIYIGDGKVVHASTRKSPVKISDMGRMKFNSARRI